MTYTLLTWTKLQFLNKIHITDNYSIRLQLQPNFHIMELIKKFWFEQFWAQICSFVLNDGRNGEYMWQVWSDGAPSDAIRWVNEC